MTLFLKALYDLRWQVTAWGLGLGGIAAGMVFVFPSIQNMPQLLPFLEELPAPIKALVGDVSAFAVFEGFFRVKFFDSLPLLLSIFAVMHGSHAIAGEEERGTLDLLLAQPVRRAHLVVANSAALGVSLAAIVVILSAAILLAVWIRGVESDRGQLFLLSMTAMLPAWAMGSAALLASSWFHRQRPAATLVGAFVLASYFIHAIGLVVPSLDAWRRLSLFYHYTEAIPLHQPVHGSLLLVPVVVGSLLLAAAVVSFDRKDLR